MREAEGGSCGKKILAKISNGANDRSPIVPSAFVNTNDRAVSRAPACFSFIIACRIELEIILAGADGFLHR
jgi:hypothetical protein